MVGMGFGWIWVDWVVLVCVGWMKLNNAYYFKTLISFDLRGTRYQTTSVAQELVRFSR